MRAPIGSRRLWVAVAVGAGLLACRRRPEPSLSPANVEAATPESEPLATRALLALGPVLRPGYVTDADVHFEVRADAEVHGISPLIYGINYDLRAIGPQRMAVLRLGGNRWTAYNWETNASNAGADFHFQNDSLLGETDAPAAPVLEAIDAAAPTATSVIVTLSIADHVSADKNGGGDVRQSGPTYLATRFKQNQPKKPSPFTDKPDPTDAFVYQDELVAFLKAARPKARLLFSLDNEPDLWSHTHAELFPSKVTYADLWRRNHDFAAAAKAVWPEAPILGVVSYGYNGFLTLQDAADAAGRPFLEWYLDQARAAEQAEGRRLIDYLDVHWYPEATAEGQRVVSDAVIPAVIEAREQAPRSLWDRGYQEASWIRDKAGGPLNLIPWLQAKIAGHYPGTKLAFSEWNYGGGKHVSGAIAVCDVLGVFGRSGVDLATYWPMSNSEEFALAAFRVFRNFDGAGAHFGDTSVSAGSSDVATATVYASIDRANPMRMVIVAINKAPVARNAGVQIAHPAVFLHARTFVLTGASTNIQAGPALEPVATNAFMYPMPPQSVSIILPEE